jgi:hypothetical protein
MLLLFIACFPGFFSQSQGRVLFKKEFPPDFSARMLSKKELSSDIRFWQETMEETHVNPYHAISRQDLNTLSEKLLQSLPDSLTHAQACFTVSELIGSLNEGHLGFATNRVADSLYAYHSLRFPYFLEDIGDDGSFVVGRDLSADKRLPPLSRIIEVNGISTKLLYQKYRRFNGGLEEWRKIMTRNGIRKMLFLDGILSPFRIKAVNGADTLNITVEGFNKEQGDSISKVLSRTLLPPEPFLVNYRPGNIALIEFNSMDGRLADSFAVFLRKTFSEINSRKIRGVIVDLRRNGGGDSKLGDMLLGYITDKSYRMSGGMQFKMSAAFRESSQPPSGEHPYKNFSNGKLYKFPAGKPKKPNANPLRFQGKVCVLIGPGTFSSANMLSNAIKDFKLATLIGEPTAEPGNDFGEIFYFMLPHTGIVAGTACKMFVRANGDSKDFGGIKPDIEARPTPADMLSKTDRALRVAEAWINK